MQKLESAHQKRQILPPRAETGSPDWPFVMTAPI